MRGFCMNKEDNAFEPRFGVCGGVKLFLPITELAQGHLVGHSGLADDTTGEIGFGRICLLPIVVAYLSARWGRVGLG